MRHWGRVLRGRDVLWRGVRLGTAAVVLMCAGMAVGQDGSAAGGASVEGTSRVVLHSGGVVGEAVGVSSSGVVVRSGGAEFVVGWDRVGRVEGALAGEAGAFAELADKAWRARTRLERGDAVSAEPLYEELFERLDETGGATALSICEGLLRCRLWRGALASALGPWLQWVRLAGEGASAGVVTGGSVSPGRPRVWAMALLPVIDEGTGLVVSLPPMWMAGPSVRALASGGDGLVGSLVEGGGRALDLAELYVSAARFEAGDRRAAPVVTSADPGVRLVSDLVVARVGDSTEREGARGSLRARLGTELPAWQEAWVRVGLGRSLVLEGDREQVLRGVVELMHLPARFGEEQAYLTAVALAEGSAALGGLGLRAEAEALELLLERQYAGHPAFERSEAGWRRGGRVGGGGGPAGQEKKVGRGGGGASAGQPVGSAGGGGQPAGLVEVEEEAVASSEDDVEAFLERHGLRQVLAAQLRGRLSAARAGDRLVIAERLSRVYVELMAQAGSLEELGALEAFSQSLLQVVPEAEAYGLRLDLAKARYLQAETVMEDWRLRLGSAERAGEAERVLRSVLGTFDQIGVAVHRRVGVLEAQEERGRLEGDEAGRRALAEGRRLRSLAHYYAGWTRYYLAMAGSNPGLAREAMVDFGWLLNAPAGEPATVDRLAVALLKYEHIARAAIGCGLCASLRGESVEAIRWLEAVGGSTELSAVVREQVFERRLQVLCAARRWNDLAWQVERMRRQRGTAEAPGRLSVREARQLAIGTLEALRGPAGPAGMAQVAEQLAQGALADLVSAGQVVHVLDLVQRYGTAPMGGQGFIVAFVRGLQTYDQARAAHLASGEDPSKPTTQAGVINAYRQSAELLGGALGAEDGQKFPGERAQCGIMLGFARFYAGDYEEAADALEGVAATASDQSQAREALWVAIVALDEAVERGRPSLTERRDRLALLFLERHPGSARAAELLVRRAASGLIDDEPAVQILLGVERSSPLYASARRHAAGLLYRLYRRATGQERDFAALRLADVAEEVIRMDAEAAREAPTAGERGEAAGQVVLRGRQVLDALLGASAPDLSRAEAMLGLVERTLELIGPARPAEVVEELAFRRVQIALGRGDEAQITRRLDELRALGGPLARTADRMIYTRAARAWAVSPLDAGLAGAVVASGQRVIGQYAQPPAGFDDPSVPALYAGVAEASAVVFRATGDTTYREIAVRLDVQLMEHGRATAAVLRRLAGLAESAGNESRALECWRQLLGGLTAGSVAWFEARYESLRLLSGVDRAEARRVMDQHRVLYPEYGPDPWGERLRELDVRMGASAGGSSGRGGGS